PRLGVVVLCRLTPETVTHRRRRFLATRDVSRLCVVAVVLEIVVFGYRAAILADLSRTDIAVVALGTCALDCVTLTLEPSDAVCRVLEPGVLEALVETFAGGQVVEDAVGLRLVLLVGRERRSVEPDRLGLASL